LCRHARKLPKGLGREKEKRKSGDAAVGAECGSGAIIGRLAFFRKKTAGDLPFGAVISHAFAAKPFFIARIRAGAALKILFFVRTVSHHLFSENFFESFHQCHHLLVRSNGDA
jgi:hypothetical protein